MLDAPLPGYEIKCLEETGMSVAAQIQASSQYPVQAQGIWLGSAYRAGVQAGLEVCQFAARLSCVCLRKHASQSPAICSVGQRAHIVCWLV